MDGPEQSGKVVIGRLASLSDGVYAIAMTILIFGLNAPHVKTPVTSQALFAALAANWHQFVNFVVSFLILGSLWLGHVRQLRIFARTNRKHVWLNLLGLMLVCLIPFSMDMCGDYPEVFAAMAVFHINLLLVGLASYAQWAVGVRDLALHWQPLEPKAVAIWGKRTLVLPGAAFCALVTAYWLPNWSTLIYLGVPLVMSRLRIQENQAP